MPLILLLVGLLGPAPPSLLVISTTLAQGAFRITNLQEQNANLARQEQTLTQRGRAGGEPGRDRTGKPSSSACGRTPTWASST